MRFAIKKILPQHERLSIMVDTYNMKKGLAIFIEEVKKRAITEKNLLTDQIYEDAEWLLNLLHTEHNKISDTINIKEYPHIIYTMAYQDGMMDGLERALNYKASGEYSHPCYLDNISNMYSEMIDEKIENNGRLEDITYLDGYNLSLLFLVLDKDDRPEIHPPLYSVFGTENINNIDDLKKALNKFPSKFKNEYKYAHKLVSEFKDNQTYHHRLKAILLHQLSLALDQIANNPYQ